MQKSCITGTLLCFSENYLAAVTKTYLILKKEEIVNMEIFVLFRFWLYAILRRNILNISKTIFEKLIFHLRLREQLPVVFLYEFQVHSAYVTKFCI